MAKRRTRAVVKWFKRVWAPAPGKASQTMDPFENLYRAILDARANEPANSKTAKLFRDGLPKMVKKLAEEAIEVGIEALQGKRKETIEESADMIYQLYVLLAEMGIKPSEIAGEVARREQLYGIAEKLPKGPASKNQTIISA